jgi:hypothetical protein
MDNIKHITVEYTDGRRPVRYTGKGLERFRKEFSQTAVPLGIPSPEDAYDCSSGVCKPRFSSPKPSGMVEAPPSVVTEEDPMKIRGSFMHTGGGYSRSGLSYNTNMSAEELKRNAPVFQ